MITDPSVDATIHEALSRSFQSDWLKSVQLLARAKTLLWNESPISVRQQMLARAEAEDQRHQMKETK